MERNKKEEIDVIAFYAKMRSLIDKATIFNKLEYNFDLPEALRRKKIEAMNALFIFFEEKYFDFIYNDVSNIKGGNDVYDKWVIYNGH